LCCQSRNWKQDKKKPGKGDKERKIRGAGGDIKRRGRAATWDLGKWACIAEQQRVAREKTEIKDVWARSVRKNVVC